MRKTYNIYYNDGASYGSMTFTNKTQNEIELLINKEIAKNNKNGNPLYHINKSNFKLEK